ncbi:hypothetical protein GINT2_001953 [Glugoides intestinalis]
MYILSNYNKDVPFDISTNNGLISLQANENGISFVSVESNSPVQYFCVSHEDSATFSRDDFIPSKFFIVETMFEKDIEQLQDTGNAYENLIISFGDKRNKERISKSSISQYTQKGPITFNIENQLLPPFDKEAESVKEAYSIYYMFNQRTLEAFEEAKVDPNELSAFVQENYNPEKKQHMLLLHCLCKALEEKNLHESVFCRYKVFYNEIKDCISKGRLLPLERDRLVVKFLIVHLLASDYEVNLKGIPRFMLSTEKLSSLLRMIGCTINRAEVVRLENLPIESFKTKRQRK